MNIIERVDEWKVYRANTKPPDIPMEHAMIIADYANTITRIIEQTDSAPSCLCCREKLLVNDKKRANPGAMIVGIEKGKAIFALAICYPCAAKTDTVIVTILKAAISLMLAGGEDDAGPQTRH